MKCLRAWPGDDFSEALKIQLAELGSDDLPLAAAMTQGGQIDDSEISFSVLGVDETVDALNAKVGVFFKEVVGGCNCSEDPVAHNTYCEMIVEICRKTGNARFLASD